jgi:hypothetical protein
VKECVDEAGRVYNLFGAASRLQFVELDDYNRFSPESQKIIFERLKALAGVGNAGPEN